MTKLRINNNVNTKSNKFIKGFKNFIIANIIYLASIFVTQHICSLVYTPIKSQSELEKLCDIEKKKLSCNKNIKVRLVDYDESKSMVPISYEKYDTCEIIIGGGASNLSFLRHELFHIYDDNENNFLRFNTIRYFYWDEPRATLYGNLGLKF